MGSIDTSTIKIPLSWGEIIALKCVDLISEWDITDKGNPAPLNRENKRKVIEKIGGCPVKQYRIGEGDWIEPGRGEILGILITNLAAGDDIFLKN